MSGTIHVRNISSQTSEKEVRDFFSFCGKIVQLSITKNSDAADSPQTATVTFEKETAAKTALLLDNTQLGPSTVNVTSGASLGEIAKGSTAETSGEASGDLEQEDKPRSRILAEYLAHGYVIGDKAIEQALALDKQHGISQRFTDTLSQFDAKYRATERVQAVDQKYSVSSYLGASWAGLTSYFNKAAQTQTGLQLRKFYEQGEKQVLDVHSEAKHLAGLKSGKEESGMHNVEGTNRTKCNCGADTGKCPCAPGTCACDSCAKNPDQKTTNITPEQAEMEKVQVGGELKTKCNCGGVDGKCPCEPGKCACSGCSKAS